MLSYRHSYHAGNFADVLKHIVLVEILQSLAKKEKPFEYIDTHSGAGLYHLHSPHGEKLAEYKNGIARLRAGNFPELSRYLEIVDQYDRGDGLNFYPGSPIIAQKLLRQQDHAWLYELHSTDFALLSENVQRDRRMNAIEGDGYKGLLSRLPPTARRGLILIDPSYEIKTEYDWVTSVIEKAYKKFSTGIYALWYPVVEREKINRVEKRLIATGIKNIQQFELGVAADSIESGMTATGMFVINPPWGLHEKMAALLPKLKGTLSESGDAFFKCQHLVAE